MAPANELLDVMREKEQRPAAVLDQLKHHYRLTDAQIAEPLGMAGPEIQMRRKGRRGFSPAQIAGLAAFFGVPEQVFYMTPGDAAKIALERDPKFSAPSRWLTAVDDSDDAREASPDSACFTAADDRDASPSPGCFTAAEKVAARRRHPSAGLPARAARAA